MLVGRSKKKGSSSSSTRVKAEKGKNAGMEGSNKRSSSNNKRRPPLPESQPGDYRGLRHKYLVLEEESASLDRALGAVESDIGALEDRKSALLDHLVVLEGLIHPSELKNSPTK